MLSGGTIQYIDVKLDNSDVTRVAIEEFHPYEPSAYVHEAGWTCFDGDNEYFISKDSGLVYGQREDDGGPDGLDCGPDVFVGVAPEVKKAADLLERQLDKAYGGAFRDEERYGR